MKKLLALLFSALIAVSLFAFVGCGGGGTNDGGNGGDNGQTELTDITGISFNDVTVTYDGQEHKAEISGTLPEGVTCSYTCNGQAGNSAVNAGTYNVAANLSGEGYNSKTLTAKLTINKAEITGITFANSTVTYDGQTHSLQVSGTLPSGVTCTYDYNGQAVNQFTNAGEYTVKATLKGDNYITKELTAKLTINKAEITGVTLSDDTVEYDGLPHSINVVGNVPTGVNCVYTYNGEALNEVTDTSEYTVKATLTGDNYITKELTAVLKITSTEEQLYSLVVGNKVYFQNPLDENYLYVYDGTELNKVASDKAQYLTSDGSTIYYTSNGLFSNTIKSLNTTTDASSSFYSANASHITTDGTYIYYAINNLVNYNDTNGIYKYKIGAQEDEVATRLTTDKASYLNVVGGYIYYANGSGKGVLKKISVNGGTATQITDDNVSDIVANGNYLYFNVRTLTGNAIHRYSINGNTLTKMTTDSGKNLTVVGNRLYYINIDLLTGSVFGKGVYYVSLNADGSLPGTQLFEAEVSSLTSDGTYLYYYLRNNKHLHQRNLADNTVTDIMEGFQPIDNTTVTGYAYAKEYNGELYYINPRDNGAIYKHNYQTKANYKVIADSCSEFYFNDGYLYYSTYVVTNYDLYRVKLDTFGSVEKISKNRCDKLIFDGEYMYYVDNGATYNTLRRLKPDSTAEDKEDEVLYGSTNSSVHFLSLEKIGDNIWFCINPAIGYKTINCYNVTTKQTTKIGNGELLTAYGNTIYFYNQKDKQICSVADGSTTVTTLVRNVEVTSMAVKDGVLYYSGTCNAKTGLHSVKTDGTNDKDLYEGNCYGVTATSEGVVFYDSAITYSNDYPIHSTSGTGKLYIWNGTTAKLLF